jgi:DNA (cytosine-5)-methyltransferase 1
MEFQFPYPITLKIFLKDILEKEVDKKYYLSEKLIQGIIRRMKDKEIKINPPISSTICARYEATRGNETFIKTRDVEIALEVAQDIANKNNKPVQVDLMYLQNGEIRPLSTYIPQDLDVHRCLQSGEPKEVLVEPKVILLDSRKWQGEEFLREYESVSPCLMSRARNDETPILVQKHHSEEVRTYKDVCPTIGGNMGGDGINVMQTKSIRRLTPKECFRLMGFLNDEISLEGLSSTQCYKLAGNGWDINLASKIFKQMFVKEEGRK